MNHQIDTTYRKDRIRKRRQTEQNFTRPFGTHLCILLDKKKEHRL